MLFDEMIQELSAAALRLMTKRLRIMDALGAYTLIVRVNVGSFLEKVNIKTL